MSIAIPDTAEMIEKGYDTFIRDEAPRDHFTQIPNVVDDYGLSPQAYRLYGHLRRVAGEAGKSWQSTKTLAAACVMSTGAVSEAKKELTEAIVPFIRIEKKNHGSGQWDYDEITITDIWKLNHDVYDPDFTVHNVNRSHYEQTVHNVKLRISLIKNNPNGGKPPKTVLSIENTIFTGQPVTEEILKEQKHKQMMDAANIIGMSFGVNAGAGSQHCSCVHGSPWDRDRTVQAEGTA